MIEKTMGEKINELRNEPLLSDFFVAPRRGLDTDVLLREILALRRELKIRDQREENARERAAAGVSSKARG